MIRHRAAVLGDPVEHSLSPAIHNAGYAAAGLDDWEYGRFRCTAEDLPGIVGGADDSYAGFSVTMPGKFAALEFADAATDGCSAFRFATALAKIPIRRAHIVGDCRGLTLNRGELFSFVISALQVPARIRFGGSIVTACEVVVPRHCLRLISQRQVGRGEQHAPTQDGAEQVARGGHVRGPEFYFEVQH